MIDPARVCFSSSSLSCRGVHIAVHVNRGYFKVFFDQIFPQVVIMHDHNYMFDLSVCFDPFVFNCLYTIALSTFQLVIGILFCAALSFSK